MEIDQTTIHELMEKHEIPSIRQLALKVGITQQKMHYRLKGDISLKTLALLAEFFDVHIKDMFKD